MLYLVHKDDHAKYTCYLAGKLILDEFKRHCNVIDETTLVATKPISDADTVIILISLKTELAKQYLKSVNCRKILISHDETKSDGVLYRTQLELANEVGIREICNAFPAKRNIDFLNQHFTHVYALPFALDTVRIVDFASKQIDVLISGQIDRSYYPIRSKITSALSKTKSIKTVMLNHSGFSTDATSHKYHSESYFDLLDQCWMGVTCKAGYRDRLVAKYIEFGFSKVLPIGDAPSYMNVEMKNAMCIINETDSDSTIIDTISSLLENKQQLKTKILEYSDATIENHMIQPLISKFICELNV